MKSHYAENKSKLIRKLLNKQLSNWQIAETVGCSTAYVAKVKWRTAVARRRQEDVA